MGPAPPLIELKGLSFDIYGTLIDDDAGVLQALEPLLSQLPPTHPCRVSDGAAIAAFNKHERTMLGAQTTIMYDEDLMRETTRRVAADWGLPVTEAQLQAVPDSVRAWRAFDDTVAAMCALGKRYKLIALSNVSRSVFAQTKAHALRDVSFDAVYLAEDIGSCKPDPRNFEYLLQHAEQDLGLAKHEIMHVAHGVATDQVPAEQFGISHAWIERGVHNWGTTDKQEGLRAYQTLGDLAADVEESFGGTK